MPCGHFGGGGGGGGGMGMCPFCPPLGPALIVVILKSKKWQLAARAG